MSTPSIDCASPEICDFTDAEHRRLLELAASKYRFASYAQTTTEPFVIWRHDVDYSPHRALAFAKMESELGLRCIYHVLLSGRYYNAFEPEIADILRQIGAFGHEIGLHFDMDVVPDSASFDPVKVIERIAFEKRVLETITGAPVASMSFHNFTLHKARLDLTEHLCGMTNASARRFQDGFKYVSDSNGIWRYDRLSDVLNASPFPRLHVLTHPIWWTPEPMHPVNRLRRVIDGRARANFDFYTAVMKRDGRFTALAERLGFTGSQCDGA